MNRAFRIGLPWVMCLLTCSMTSGLETQFGLEFTDTIIIENNLYDTDNADGFTYDSRGNEALLYPSLDLVHGDHLNAFFMAEFSWIHYIDDHDDDTDVDLTHAFVCLTNESALLCLGMQPVTAGRGQIHDDSEPAVSVDVKLPHQLSLNATIAALDDSSSLFSLNFGYVPDLFEKMDVFAAYYRSGDDAMSKHVYYYEEYDGFGLPVIADFPSASGSLTWFGAGADLFVYGNYLSLVVALERGNMELTSDNGYFTRQLDVSSFMADAELTRNIHDDWSLSTFLRIESGGDSNDLNAYQFKGYITPSPINYRTLVFPNTLLLPESDREGWIIPVMSYNGLVNPGVGIGYVPRDDLYVKGLASLCYPYSSEDGSFYGLELDVILAWDIRDNMGFHFQAGYFEHGDVAENLQGEKPPPASCVAAGLTVSF